MQEESVYGSVCFVSERNLTVCMTGTALFYSVSLQSSEPVCACVKKKRINRIEHVCSLKHVPCLQFSHRGMLAYYMKRYKKQKLATRQRSSSRLALTSLKLKQHVNKVLTVGNITYLSHDISSPNTYIKKKMKINTARQ